MMAAILSGGAATHQIPSDPEREVGISQVFLAFAVSRFGDASGIAGSIIDSLGVTEGDSSRRIRYPGEQVLRIRADNLAQGIPVDPRVWSEIQAL
jgi:3-dehydro-L-gulonate 2-dehydrogenase